MKICFVGDSDNIHFQRWVDYFFNAGHKTYTVSLKGNNLNPRVFYKKMKFTKEAIKDINPDIVHAHYVSSYGIHASYANRHPLVISVWGSDILLDYKKYFFLRPFIKKALRNANIVTVDGDNTWWKVKKLVKDPEKIKTIYHGVDTELFNPYNTDTEVKSSFPTVITTRTKRKIHDYETFEKAMNMVKEHYPDLKILTIEDIPHPHMPWYYNQSDVYVSSCYSDGGISISTLEAMSCELPVVVTNTGDNSRWIKHGKNGYLFEPHNAHTLAMYVIKLLDTLLIRKEIGIENRNVVKTHFEYKYNMREMEKIYEDIVNRWNR